MTEHLTDLPKIPKELEPLAEEARKYKSAEEFEGWWHKEEVNIFATRFPPMEIRGNLLRAGFRLPEGGVNFKSFWEATQGKTPEDTAFKVGETVQQRNIYTGEIVHKGKITKIKKLSTPATGFIPKNYYEIEGKGLIAEDLLEAVQKGNPRNKKPWQMTKEEFKSIVEGDNELPLITKYLDETGKTVPTKEDYLRVRSEIAKKYPKEWKKIQQNKIAKLRIYNSLPEKVRRRFGINQLNRFTHINFVGQALSEGKPVPPEVLKDYPELLGKSEEHLS